MISKITYGALREYLLNIGFEEFPSLTTHFRFDHQPSESVILLRRYLRGELVSEMDLADVRKILLERGVVREDSFEDFLHRSPVNGQDETDLLFRVFFAVCELGEALNGKPVASTRSRRMSPEWLPYNSDFHRLGALDELMRHLRLNGEPLNAWTKNLEKDWEKCPKHARSILERIGKAIYPLIYDPKREQAKVKEAAYLALGQAARDLKLEIENREKRENKSLTFGSWASDLDLIWPPLVGVN